MKETTNIVISGSASLKEEVLQCKENFEKLGYNVLDYPKAIDENNFMELYPDVHKNFFDNITKADTLYIMNEDKNGIEGYIGAETFAELTFGLAQKLVNKKDIDLVLKKEPSQKVQCYNEIKLWKELGWIRVSNDL